jgi:IS30 family transposase
MKNVVSLSTVRKTVKRQLKRAEGDANAIKYGRTKAQKFIENADKKRAEKMLDEHNIDG